MPPSPCSPSPSPPAYVQVLQQGCLIAIKVGQTRLDPEMTRAGFRSLGIVASTLSASWRAFACRNSELKPRQAPRPHMLCALRVLLRVAMHTTRSTRTRDIACGYGKVKRLQGGGCYLTGTSSSRRCATPPTSTLVMLVLTCLPIQERNMSDMEQSDMSDMEQSDMEQRDEAHQRPSSSKTKTLAQLGVLGLASAAAGTSAHPRSKHARVRCLMPTCQRAKTRSWRRLPTRTRAPCRSHGSCRSQTERPRGRRQRTGCPSL